LFLPFLLPELSGLQLLRRPSSPRSTSIKSL
jgi:hypothetical protein